MHIMLDLETLSTANNALIVSIGAVKFNMEGIHTSFFEVVDLLDINNKLFDIDPSTVGWWLGQTKKAQKHILIPTRDSLDTLLIEFSHFVKTHNHNPCKIKGIWGNGSTFDNVILRNAYKILKLQCPWHFRYDRCYRTLKYSLPDEPFERIGTHHNPLDDAKSQALHLIKLCKKYNIDIDRH